MDFVLVYPLILAFFSGGHSYTKVTEQTSNSCYKSCPAGYHKTGNCDNQDGKYKCKECENNTFTDMENKIEKCFRCDVCNRNEVMIKPCSITSNTKCDCIPGYYNAHRDQSSRFCVKCPCQNCQEPLDSPDFKKKCQPCQRTECLSNSECKRKCTPTTVPPPKSTTKSTTHVTTRSNSTLNPVVITLGPETLKNSLWRFLVVMLIFVVLFCFVLLFIWTHRNSCPYWSTNKGVKPHAKDPKLKEHRSHQDSSPTTLTINISEETPMMHLNYSPATPQHPANISPNTLHKGEERKTDARASCLIMSALVQPGVKVSELCEDGDKLLEAGELGRATSLYMSAFRTHATSTVSHMRKLEKSSLIGVISTLEGWLDSHGENQPAEGFNKGLAAVFLSTLCPNNLTATVFKMESLLQSGGHGCEEIFARCTALLEGKRNPPPEGFSRMVLEITRALSCLFAEPHTIKGLKLYLKAYQKNKSEIVTLVKTRQAQHLSKIVKALTVQIMHMHPSLMFDSEWAVTTKENDKLSVEATALMMEFLLAISPGNRKVQELQAVQMFLTGRFGDSAEVYSALLHHGHCQKMSESSTDKSFQDSPERRAWLLTGRAAACFSAGGRTAEACGDLGEAFEIHPATARIYFQKLFTDHGTGVAARNHLRQQAERGLYGYRERVLLRPDLRSTEGVELLDPVITQLRTLCLLEPDGGGRELRVRLADCLLLRGEHKEALSICSQLAATQSQQSYQNTVQVLRGYARLLSDDHKGALEDFQAVIEHNAPHPSSCVRALCGRGLLRMMGGLNYLTALDYVTASRLHPQEAALTVRCLVPWNCRGLLFTVLLEQGRVMLEGTGEHKSKSRSTEDSQHLQQEDQLNVMSKRDNHRSGTPAGVHSLALLLMELQPGADGPQILAADALYQLGRVEEAYRLLLSVGPTSPRAPILARLALLQLHRGFLYDTNQLLKKLIQCGDTSCLCPLLAVAQQKDRALLRGHCHSAAKRILEGTREESAVREAVAYLSIAIMASGGEAADSLLERARCYALLNQRKTAIFDFSAILKEHPKHVQALCGRGFTYLLLNQQQECTHDILAALQINTDMVTKDILSLKDKARKLVGDWLHQFCRTNLSDILVTNAVPCHEEQLREAFIIGGALMRTDCRDPRWHLLYVDILLAKGEVEAASVHLCQVFGQDPRDAVAQARVGVVEAWQQNYRSAARRLSKLTEKDPLSLDFLLALIPFSQRKRMAQAAAQEASSVSSAGQWDQALTLLTVAVQAVGSHRLQYLRQRAACLAQLGLHKQAIADLDRVIQKHGGSDPSCSDDPQVWAEDLCRRGRSLVLCSREGAALEDFTRALELHRDQAILCVEAGLGRLHLAECFLRGALQHYGEQQLSKAWTLIECGLTVDSENAELRRLRARVKREVASPCNVN